MNARGSRYCGCVPDDKAVTANSGTRVVVQSVLRVCVCRCRLHVDVYYLFVMHARGSGEKLVLSIVVCAR